MQVRSLSLAVTFLALVVSSALAAERSYQRPLETAWDAAVKACRDAELVVLDSDREEHVLEVRTRSWYSSKKGDRLRITLTGNDTTATVRIVPEDPARAEAVAKHIESYLAALDERLD